MSTAVAVLLAAWPVTCPVDAETPTAAGGGQRRTHQPSSPATPSAQRVFPEVVNVGAILSSDAHGEFFLKKITDENVALVESRRGYRLNGTYILMDTNPIRAAKSVCEVLIPGQVYVVIASQAQSPSELSPMAVSFTCGFYKIPVIGLTARESTFSDKVYRRPHTYHW